MEIIPNFHHSSLVIVVPSSSRCVRIQIQKLGGPHPHSPIIFLLFFPCSHPFCAAGLQYPNPNILSFPSANPPIQPAAAEVCDNPPIPFFGHLQFLITHDILYGEGYRKNITFYFGGGHHFRHFFAEIEDMTHVANKLSKFQNKSI
jgi:hypothetical protein